MLAMASRSTPNDSAWRNSERRSHGLRSAAVPGLRLNQSTFGIEPDAGVEQLQPALVGERA